MAILSGAVIAQAPARRVTLKNVAQSAGITFVLDNSPTPEKHLSKACPAASRSFDYDGDGRARSVLHQRRGVAGAGQERRRATGIGCIATTAAMRFTDVDRARRLAGDGYSMGAAAADYDNDGDIDLFVAGVGGNQLYRNTRRRTFEDVTGAAGHRRAANGRSAAAGSTTTTTAISISSSSTTWTGRRSRTVSAATRRARFASTVIRATSRACRIASIATAATARSKTCRARRASRVTSARG